MIQNLEQLKDFFKNKISHISAETFGWLAAIVLHASTLPSMLAVMSGLTDRLPAVDLVLLLLLPSPLMMILPLFFLPLLLFVFLVLAALILID